MTIIGNDNFWLLWIIQLLFDVVILLAVILQKPARNTPVYQDEFTRKYLREDDNGSDNGNPGDATANRPDVDRLRRSGEYGH
jgi:hypothetical protein